MPFQRLRGTHDIFGKEALLFEKVESSARAVFHRFGFEEFRTPILEEKDLFTRALGAETDVVQKEMYEFEDRSKMRVAMRPEGTAGIVRAYLENNLDKTQGLCKFYYIGPMFRSERPQAGRLRQFHQIGVEELGTDSPYADAEVILCLKSFFDSLGLNGYKVKLNMLGTFEERNSFKKELLEYFTPLAASFCDDCRNRLEKNVYRLFDCKIESCRAIIKKSRFIIPNAPLLPRKLSESSHIHFDKVRQTLEAASLTDYLIEPSMVRGLDYYTKTVFEISHPKLGAQDALAAGGRYDHLIETFGGKPAGAVGFAIGVERLLMCVDADNGTRKSEKVFFVVTLGETAFNEGFKLLTQLRSKGLSSSMDFLAKSLKSQMRAADKAKADFVLILGDNELKKKVCVLKDMKSGEQKEISLEDAAVSLLHHTT